jgi:integrase
MSKSRKKKKPPKRVLALPDLEQAKSAVLSTLSLAAVRRVAYEAGDRGFDRKGRHIRTVPIPLWVKRTVDAWTTSAQITDGRMFRSINKAGTIWGDGMTPKVIWEIVKDAAGRAGIEKLAPHDLRRTCARLCHLAGGELDQIQFLLGHVPIQTTELPRV